MTTSTGNGSVSAIELNHAAPVYQLEPATDSGEDSGCENEIHSFEGPEKTLEVAFKKDIGASNGLRCLSRSQLDILCTKARCSIMSKMSNDDMDAYVLSESSLFVYSHRFIMKTCGTTTLLRCLNTLLEYADALELEISWVDYSRKNLSNPSAQLWPHSSFDCEIQYLNSHTALQNRLQGAGHVLGPITGDHWYVYVADHSHECDDGAVAPVSVGGVPRLLSETDGADCDAIIEHGAITVNLMMFDMAEQVSKHFFESRYADVDGLTMGQQMTAASGINTLLDGFVVDERAFSPCGYSMNAICGDSYATIHVTPEPHCSYVSFETNADMECYSDLVRKVLGVFRPKRFVLTLFGDDGAIERLTSVPMSTRRIVSATSKSADGCDTFKRTSFSSTKAGYDLTCMMGCYVYESHRSVVQPLSPAQKLTPQTVMAENGKRTCFHRSSSPAIP